MGIAAYIRAEFLKIRNYEFVKAAKSLGVSNFKIMRRHILPNALTPVVTFFPFEVTAGIQGLVSIDFLNLGLDFPKTRSRLLLCFQWFWVFDVNSHRVKNLNFASK